MSNDKRSERGMTLFAVLAVMTISAVALLAVAPSIQQEIQREKEIEATYRGEEMAEAIRQYVEFYRGAKLPNSMDDLLNGLPAGGTRQRYILRASSVIDPLSEDGRWRLVQADVSRLGGFARRVQNYNGGMLPPNPSNTFDRYTMVLSNSLNVDLDSDDEGEPDDDFDVITDNVPFIGVASQSRSRSIITYYGTENHSKWVFTPLFRGARGAIITRPPRPLGLGPAPTPPRR
jgi:type II secretory pathway pseudopilin PulG